MFRRDLVLGISFAALLVLSPGTAAPEKVQAADYPDKPVQFIVAYAPGGVLDLGARLIAAGSAESLGQPLVILNKPGAGGALGTDFIAKAKPDGYTLGLGPVALAILKAINPNLSFDPVKDLTPICRLSMGSNVMVVRSDSQLNTLDKLVDYARKNPGKLNYGSSGVGGSLHFAGELFQREAGIQMVHVPYKGGAPALMALLGGHIELTFNNLQEAIEQIKAGKVIPLAVTLPERYPELPQVPSVAEKGYPGAVITSWTGVVGPAGLPRPVVEKISAYCQKVISRPDILKKLKEFWVTPAYLGPVEYGKFIASEVALYKELAGRANIKAE